MICSVSTKLGVSGRKESSKFTFGRIKQLDIKGRKSITVEHL